MVLVLLDTGVLLPLISMLRRFAIEIRAPHLLFALWNSASLSIKHLSLPYATTLNTLLILGNSWYRIGNSP